MNTILTEAIADFDSSAVRHSDAGKRNGVIADPGRLEGETLLTVYCDHLEGNGCGGECLSDMEDGSGEYVSMFDVDDEMRSELAAAGYDLDSDTVAVLYTVSDSGFVSTEEISGMQRLRINAA